MAERMEKGVVVGEASSEQDLSEETSRRAEFRDITSEQ